VIMGTPVRYDPSLEHVAPDEAETRAALMTTMRSIAETTCRDYGYAVRSVHAKSYALLEGELMVPDGLPADRKRCAMALEAGRHSSSSSLGGYCGGALPTALSSFG
jgi:hypothetical protein